MSLLDKIAAIFAPFSCLGCGDEGTELCPQCATALPACHPIHQFKGLNVVWSRTNYQGMARQIVHRAKFEFAYSTLQVMADTMASILPDRKDYLIVPVVTSPLRHRQRGYDQSIVLARQIAQLKNLAYKNVLVRAGTVRQMGAPRTIRLHQVQGAYFVRKPSVVVGRKILLIDDVVTTGATLEAAASSLLTAGAESVRALVFARA